MIISTLLNVGLQPPGLPFAFPRPLLNFCWHHWRQFQLFYKRNSVDVIVVIVDV